MHDEHEVHQVHLGADIEESPREYKKLAGVIGAIFLIAVFLGWARGFQVDRFVSDFLAVFFITFASFKLFNIEEFVAAYRSYDIIAKHLRPWAYMFPFIEGVLGLFYLLLTDNLTLNLITILITGIGAYGVRQELKNKSNIMSACLGTIIRLPLSKVSLVENATMFAAATAIIIL